MSCLAGNTMSLRGAQRRGNLPAQFYGYRGTDVEVTFYREIPTDGKAVLGMTHFYPAAPILAASSLKVREGQDPPLQVGENL